MQSDLLQYQGSYVYKPKSSEHGPPARPAKCRRTETNCHVNQNGFFSFVPLLNGHEELQYCKIRLELFEKIWRQKETSLDVILQDADKGIIDDVVSFVKGLERPASDNRIPVALILAGHNIATYNKLFALIIQRIELEDATKGVRIPSNQATNLKSILKYINRYATISSGASSKNGSESEEQDYRYLNYDLQKLYDRAEGRSLGRVVLCFEDSEAIEGSLLTDVIDVLRCAVHSRGLAKAEQPSSWTDRIPFVLLFGIATSIDAFQEKLSRNTIRQIRGSRFEGVRSEDTVKLIFEAATWSEGGSAEDSIPLYFGPEISRIFLERQQEVGSSVRGLIQALKYAYMTHFFVNPLSVLLQSCGATITLQKEHYAAVRNLSSFRIFAEHLLKQKDFEIVSKLLEDDNFLNKFVTERLEVTRRAIDDMLIALRLLQIIQTTSATAKWSDLYIKGMSGELADSPILRDILLSTKKMPSDEMTLMLSSIAHFQLPRMDQLITDLDTLTSPEAGDATILRSEHDIHHQTLRTTIVAQKVELSKQKSRLSKQDTAYTKIVDRVDGILREFFQSRLINPSELFLHEVLVYDFKSPHRDIFMPKVRFAIERALSSPHDYLDCECCDAVGNALSSTQPATAILYQLYLESGALINTSDLWSAFYTILGGGDRDEDEQGILALFSQGLAELRYMGMIQNSRKRADHLVKLSWKGL